MATLEQLVNAAAGKVPREPSESQTVDWQTFVADLPPHQTRLIKSCLEKVGGANWKLLAEPILHHCGEDGCRGVMIFDCDDPFPVYIDDWDRREAIFRYRCRHCRTATLIFAMQLERPPREDLADHHEMPEGTRGNLVGVKSGQCPPFGPTTSAKLTTLVGPDRELFLKGRRAESQGMGIGAFSYYRRIVEGQKNRLLDETIRVAKKVGADPDLIVELEQVKSETQFDKSVKAVNKGLPATLLIAGQNPFKLLHSALSEGLHALPDEKCLERARSIRLVLNAFAENLRHALKGQTELEAAVATLSVRK